MKRILHFWIFGGDLRQHWLARQLGEDGHIVHCCGLDASLLAGNTLYNHSDLSFCQETPCDCVILPLPLQNKHHDLTAPFSSSPISFSLLLDALPSSAVIVGGQIKEEAQAMAQERGLTLVDYFLREELTIANAVPTAEGCIQLAMERLPITLQDARVLILGYGKVASATAQRMGALGAKVTVAARRYAQLEQAKADGFNTDHIQQLVGGLCCYDCIVNTVPATVLGKEELEDMESSTLVIDLASLPGGVDLSWAQRLQRSIVPALSLPGRVAPATAGKSIKRTVYHILEETEQKEVDSLD